MIDDGFVPWRQDRLLNLVQVQTVSVCNASCVMCPYRESWYKKTPGYMSDSLYKKILNDIAEYDVDFDGKFCPYLCNEPFADKNILKRTELAYDTLKNPYIELSSNMELLNHDKIDELFDLMKQHNFYGKFTVSHHGIDKESFEEIMSIDYEKSLDNMVYLFKKFQGKMRLTMQDMSYSLDSRLKLQHARHVRRYINKVFKDNDINPRLIIADPKIFHNRAGNVKIDGWDYEEIVRQIDKNNPFDCLRIHGCLHAIYTGEVIGCCMDYFREAVLGDLNKMTVKEFFNSKKYHEWEEQVTGIKNSPDDFICKRCMSPGG